MVDELQVLALKFIFAVVIFIVVMIAGSANHVDGTATLILACASAFGSLVVVFRLGSGGS